MGAEKKLIFGAACIPLYTKHICMLSHKIKCCKEGCK